MWHAIDLGRVQGRVEEDRGRYEYVTETARHMVPLFLRGATLRD